MDRSVVDPKRASQVKNYLWNNRENLTREEFYEMIDIFSKDLVTYGFESGWARRNDILRASKTARRISMRKDYDEFFEEHGAKLSMRQIGQIEGLIRNWS
jgi:hypothetical protein